MNDKLKQFYKDKFRNDSIILSEQSKVKVKEKIFSNLVTQTTEAAPVSLLSKISSLLLKTYVLVPLVVLLFLSSTAIVSANALPGDILYPVKLQVENAQILLAPTQETKLDLQVNFAQKRISEAAQIKKLSSSEEEDKPENTDEKQDNKNSEVRDINTSNQNQNKESEKHSNSGDHKRKVEFITKPINKTTRQIQAEQQAIRAIEFLGSVRKQLKESGKDSKLKDIEEEIKKFEFEHKFENKSGSSNKGKSGEDNKDEHKTENQDREDNH